MNPFIILTAFAFVIQTVMFIAFYALPDSLGLSLSEMFMGKQLWQFFMAYGAILVMASLFAFAKKPRALAVFFLFYFILAVADYEVFRFSHQRLSYSFLRTYFHISNITDETTISTLGGDSKGTAAWLSILGLEILGFLSFIFIYSFKKARFAKWNKKIPVLFIAIGMLLSVTPLVLFLTGTRGIKTIPVLNAQVDMRFTLGKHTLTAPILHIAAVETFEFVRDNHKITEELVQDLDAFLPAEFPDNRKDKKEYPTYRTAPRNEYAAKQPYNIVFIFGESFKGRVINRMLDGDTTLAPNLWNLASGKYFEEGGGALWFKNAFSGGYPTVRGTFATYFGFPSHPNRDVPSFYASNHFKGFPEYLENYTKGYMTVSNPIFDHTLPFVEKFYGENWLQVETIEKPGTADSLGVDLALQLLDKMPTESPWLLVYNTIATHIPFFNYPEDFAEKPDNAMERYRNALRYTDTQFGRFLEALSKREDFKKTVIIVLGDHDTPVDSVDYAVPQPIGVSAAQIFIGIFSPDSNLIQGFNVREDVASQLDLGPTVFDLAGIRESHHFWGYDLLTMKRPYEQPAVFFSENAYYLGFRDHVLTGGLATEEIYKGVQGTFTQTEDSVSTLWRSRAVSASKVLRSILRNDKMMPF